MLEVHISAGLAASDQRRLIHCTSNSLLGAVDFTTACRSCEGIFFHALNALITVLTLLASHHSRLSFSTTLLQQHPRPKHICTQEGSQDRSPGLLPPGGQIPQGCQQRSEAALTEKHLEHRPCAFGAYKGGGGERLCLQLQRNRGHEATAARTSGDLSEAASDPCATCAKCKPEAEATRRLPECCIAKRGS